MSTYDSELTANNLSAAMKQPEVYQPIFQSAVKQSAALSMARQLPPMARGTRSLTVLDAMPTAYWQASSTSLKQTTEQTWKGKTLTAEELAVIVPIGEAVLADTEGTGYDLWSEITPRVGEAMGKLIDLAVFHGTNLPATWLTTTAGVSQSLHAGATAASTTVAAGTGLDLYDDILGESGTISLVEQKGYMVNGHVGAVSMRGKLRHVRANRDTNGAGGPVLTRLDSSSYTLDGDPILFPTNGGINPAEALLFSGDWTQLVFAIRQDITAKLITEGVVSDGDGAIVINLAQQDMVALRFVFRLSFQIANPVNALATTEATRYPFAVLTPSGVT